MAVTLVEAAKLAANAGEYRKAGIVATFAKKSPLLQAMPIVSIGGNSYAYTLEASLPTAGYRGVNEAYTESSGAFEVRSEPLKVIGGDLDVDKFNVDTNGPQIRTAHEALKATALAQTIGAGLVTGNIATAPKGINGLAWRYGNGITSVTASTQVVSNGAAALSMKNLDAAIQLVDQPTHLLMPKKMRINMLAYLRSSSTAVVMQADQFGSPVMTYAGLPILDADINGDSAAMAFNENANTTTSIYVLSLSDMGLHMIQGQGGISVRDLGEQQTKPVYRTRVEWYCGLVDEHPRCVARLYNITDATATA